MITSFNYFKIAILAKLIISGALIIIKNLPNIYFNHNTIIALNLIHLNLCIILIFINLYTLIQKKK